MEVSRYLDSRERERARSRVARWRLKQLAWQERLKEIQREQRRGRMSADDSVAGVAQVGLVQSGAVQAEAYAEVEAEEAVPREMSAVAAKTEAEAASARGATVAMRVAAEGEAASWTSMKVAAALAQAEAGLEVGSDGVAGSPGDDEIRVLCLPERESRCSRATVSSATSPWLAPSPCFVPSADPALLQAASAAVPCSGPPSEAMARGWARGVAHEAGSEARAVGAAEAALTAGPQPCLPDVLLDAIEAALRSPCCSLPDSAHSVSSDDVDEGTYRSPIGVRVKTSAGAYLRAVGVPPSALTSIPFSAPGYAHCSRRPRLIVRRAANAAAVLAAALEEVTSAGGPDSAASSAAYLQCGSPTGRIVPASSAGADGRAGNALGRGRWERLARERPRDSAGSLRKMGRSRCIDSPSSSQGTGGGGFSPVRRVRVEQGAGRANSKGDAGARLNVVRSTSAVGGQGDTRASPAREPVREVRAAAAAPPTEANVGRGSAGRALKAGRSGGSCGCAGTALSQACLSAPAGSFSPSSISSRASNTAAPHASSSYASPLRQQSVTPSYSARAMSNPSQQRWIISTRPPPADRPPTAPTASDLTPVAQVTLRALLPGAEGEAHSTDGPLQLWQPRVSGQPRGKCISPCELGERGRSTCATSDAVEEPDVSHDALIASLEADL